MMIMMIMYRNRIYASLTNLPLLTEACQIIWCQHVPKSLLLKMIQCLWSSILYSGKSAHFIIFVLVCYRNKWKQICIRVRVKWHSLFIYLFILMEDVILKVNGGTCMFNFTLNLNVQFKHCVSYTEITVSAFRSNFSLNGRT